MTFTSISVAEARNKVNFHIFILYLAVFVLYRVHSGIFVDMLLSVWINFLLSLGWVILR